MISLDLLYSVCNQLTQPIANPLMPLTASTTEYVNAESTPIQQQREDRYIFVVQQHDGTYLVGCSTNPCKRVCAINSGMHPYIKKGLTIKRIVGIKPVTDDRNLVSTFKHFEAKYGEGNVLAV